LLVSKTQAIDILKGGGNVAIPTETVYGLAGRYDSLKAVENIFRIKQRPSFDPLICHISNLEQIDLLTKNFDPTSQRLAKEFWPGPLTIVLPKSKNVDSLITAGLDTVAIRMPKHRLCQEIIEEVASPLCAPSANYFGKTSPSSMQHVETEFGGKLAVVDGGDCEIGIESTIVEVIDGQVFIHRSGMISKADMENLGFEVLDRKSKSAQGPGSMQDHYMPKVPFYLIKENKKQYLENKERLKEWKLEDDPYLAARNLYKNLRHQAETTSGFYTYISDEDGHWEAIWDRLKKASYRKDLF